MNRPATLLLVGGGRWARVYLSILARLEMPFHSVLVASRHGEAALRTALEKANAARFHQFTQVTDWRAERAGAAIVVNAAREHAVTAGALLEMGIPTLVEKPVALSIAEGEALIALAQRSGLVLRPALVLNYCIYLRNFIELMRGSLEKPVEIAITWTDPVAEKRYGEEKGHDAGIGLAEDVGPHLATLLMAMGEAARIDDARIGRGGLSVCLRGRYGLAALTIEMAREAPARKRLICIRDDHGRQARLDFSVEPGTITIDGASQSADPGWNDRPSPLTLQLMDFLRLEPGANDLDAIRTSTAFSAAAATMVRDAQRRWLAENASASDEYRLVAMRELLAPGLASAGLVRAGDNKGLETAAALALRGDTALRQYL